MAPLGLPSGEKLGVERFFNLRKIRVQGAKTYGAVGATVILIGLAAVASMRSTESAGATLPEEQQGALDPMLEARSKGAEDAPIQVYELSDFQCPYCKQFFDDTWGILQDEYIDTGKMRVTFINLPLIQIHPNAPAAHEVAMCVARQDSEKFWAIHDRLFETQGEWGPMPNPLEFIVGLGVEVGADQEVLQQCMDAGETRNVVMADVQLAIQNRLNSTPTFVIDGAVLQGAAGIDTWRPILDSIYAEKRGQ